MLVTTCRKGLGEDPPLNTDELDVGEQMIAHMAEFFRMLEEIVRNFGIQMVPPDIYCAAQTSNRILEDLGRPRMDAFDAVSEPPHHAGCELLGIYDSNEFGRGNVVPFEPVVS